MGLSLLILTQKNHASENKYLDSMTWSGNERREKIYWVCSTKFQKEIHAKNKQTKKPGFT